MPFQKQILPECPQCKQPGLKVIESRKIESGIRRRKQCQCCEFRLTTYEVADDFYNNALHNSMLVSKLNDLLDRDSASRPPMKIKCIDCKHNQNDECAYNFPEYDTIDSFDCNHHEASVRV